MLTRVGNIWDFHDEKRWIVITTNIGWKKDGTNPMGAGIALSASDKYPELPCWYGKRCKKYGADTAVAVYKPGRLILFPTKPLNLSQPWMSWKSDADIDLIRRSTIQLAKLAEVINIGTKIGLPLVGCENGNLRAKQVLPILRQYLDDRFVLFERD